MLQNNSGVSALSNRIEFGEHGRWQFMCALVGLRRWNQLADLVSSAAACGLLWSGASIGSGR